MEPGAPPPKPHRLAHPARGLLDIKTLARGRCPTQTMKRRLMRLNKRLGGKLLFKADADAHWLVRLDVLHQHLPELVTPQLEEEADEPPTNDYAAATSVARELREVREALASLTDEVRYLKEILVMR
jgi:hypothetical protein